MGLRKPTGYNIDRILGARKVGILNAERVSAILRFQSAGKVAHRDAQVDLLQIPAVRAHIAPAPLFIEVRGISNTMLSKALKAMEDDGLVIRSEYLEVPIRVEYGLTEKARQLQPILTDLIQWSLAGRDQ